MRMKNGILPILALAALVHAAAAGETTPSPTRPMDADAAKSQLLEVDRAFNARAQATDVPTAFLEFADQDAVMYRNGMEPVVGKAAIAELLEGEAGVTLVWEPQTAEIAASGDLGYTRGCFTFHTAPGEEGAPAKGPYQGYYISIWKRQADGSWKWVFDSGIISRLPSN